MSDNYLDHVDDVEAGDRTDPVTVALYGWVAATIVSYLLGLPIIAAVVVGVLGGAIAAGALLAAPGDSTFELDGVRYGSPGEWGLLADEEESE